MTEEQERALYNEYLAYVVSNQPPQALEPEPEVRPKATSSGGNSFEIATPFGRVDTGLEMSEGVENFLAGIGSGLTSVGRRAVNLALPKSLEPEWATEEALARQEAIDEELLSTGAGMGGNLAGSIAATLPAGGALRGLAAGGSQLAGRAGSPLLARALGGLGGGGGLGARAAQGGLEGGAQAALLSSPDTAGTEAAIGTGLGAAFGTVGNLAGRTSRFFRPQVTDEARDVMRKTGAFVPAAQALPEGTIGRQLNEGLLGNLPGSGGMIRAQRDEAVDAVRNHLTKEALPIRASRISAFRSGDRMSDVLEDTKAAWEEAYAPIYRQQISGVSIPADVADEVMKRSGGSIKTGGDLTGREAIDLQQAIQQLITETPGGRLERAAKNALVQARKNLDTNIMSQLSPSLQRLMKSNSARYKTWRAIDAAARKAPGGEFTMKEAARQLGKKGSREADFSMDAYKALPDFASRQGIFQTLAATGALGGAGLVGAFSAGEGATALDRLGNAALFAGGAYTIPKFLARPGVQRAMYNYGDSGVLDRYAQSLRRMGSFGRTTGINVANDLGD